jgi:hypothetical protein
VTRREIIRAPVKQIEVSDAQVRIVYRVNTDPFFPGEYELERFRLLEEKSQS